MTDTSADKTENTISADEVALYDRQIRLWGMESQARMRNSKILLINVGAVADEIVKDLVLAGIGSLTIVDSHVTTEADFGAQFFVQEGDEGKNRGEAALPRISQLNRHVTVETVDKAILDLDADFVGKFDVVVITQANLAEIVHITTLCQETNTTNIAVGISGLFSYAFVDLREYTYKVETAYKLTPMAIPAQATFVEAVELENGNYSSSIKQSFKPFKEVLKAIQTPKPFEHMRPKHKTRIPSYVPLLFAGWTYEHTNPGKSWGDLSVQEFHQLGVEQCSKLQLPLGVISEEVVEQVLTSKDAEIATTASIMGGGIAQEVLNYLARSQIPIDNFYVFDGENGASPIYRL
ncbi:DNA damage tolerance protein [Yarrowia sp. E02]|nr:DNA damage tolerance protein [Yarrowia sp. E02]